MEIDLHLHEKQGEALNSQATEILYGGAAGGGKSHLMRVAAIIWCSSIPGLQVYLFRRLLPDLVKNHLEGPKGFRAILAPWVDCGWVQIVEDEIRFWNGSKIYLCHCKDEKDRFKYQGAEIHVLLIDELTHFTDVIYRFLRSRVRAVGLHLPKPYRESFPRILCGSNPGNVGHGWVKAAFVDNGFAAWRTPTTEGGMLRQYIPARLDDNPSLLVDDPTYDQRLSGLGSPELVRAMRDGDWNVVAGAYFNEFGQQHIIRPFDIPENWLRLRSLDWGSAKPFSVGWWAVSDGTHYPYRPNELIRYREWYGMQSPNVGLKMTVEQVADGIKMRSLGETHAYSVADPAIFKEDGGPSIGERFQKAGIRFHPGDNTRIAGWEQLRGRLIGHDDRPMLHIFDTCKDLIRTLPALMHDEHRMEDIDSDGEDHAADEARYAVMSRPYHRPVLTPQEPPRGITQATYDELFNLHTPEREIRY